MQTAYLKPRLHERFFACDGDAIFLKIVASPARGENRMCSHPRTGDATDEKIAEKNREKFNELNFLRLNHGLRQRVATQAIFAARWRRDNFKKIASPSQAKNRSCSRGFTYLTILARTAKLVKKGYLKGVLIANQVKTPQ